MPLIELKSFMPVCDTCGKRDSVFRDVKAGDNARPIPDGWESRVVTTVRETYVILECRDCMEALEADKGVGDGADVQELPKDKAD